MVRVSGPSLKQLDDRGDLFAADVRSAITKASSRVTSSVQGLDDLIYIRAHWTRAVKQSLIKHLRDAWINSAADTYEQLVDAAQRVTQARTASLSDAQSTLLAAAFEVPKVSSELAELYLEAAENRLFSVGDLVWNTARTQMLEGMQAGESITEIRQRLTKTTDLAGPQAEVIARTEIIGASNAGSFAEMKATGLKADKEWIATEDRRTRPSHEIVDGSWKSIDEAFIVGGYAMLYPHDPAGPPQEVINCRCTLGWDIPEDEFMDEDDDDSVTMVDEVDTFHLLGKHNQDSHGRRGARSLLGGSIKPGKQIKMTHGLIHKKHPEGETIAVNKAGDKKVTWNGKAYNLDTKQADGSWKTEKTAIKSKAYKEVNDFDSTWHEPVAEGDADELPSAVKESDAVKPKPKVNEPAAKKSAPPTTVHKNDVYVYGLKAGEPVTVDDAFIKRKNKHGTIIAVNKKADLRVVDLGTHVSVQKKTSSGGWTYGHTYTKDNTTASSVNSHEQEWFAPLHAEQKSTPTPSPAPTPTPSAPSAPAAPAAPAPTPTPQDTAPDGTKNYSLWQQAFVKSIFGSNGVKWHSDTKKIYDAALEASQKEPSLTMSDALSIMDKSLQKKTGDPFKTKTVKFLQTKAGMKYAQEKGGSAPVGATKPTVPPAPKKPSTSYVQPGDNNPKVLSKPGATAMQKRMNELSPPPWTPAQRAALKKYTGGAYTEINKCLRGTGTCSESTLNTIKGIKGGMKPSTESIMVYRKTNAATFGLGSAADAKNLVGTTIRDDGVISTSIKDGIWHGQLHLKIEAPVGSRMAWVQPISHYPSENEIVLSPGTDFEVVSVEQHYNYPDQYVVHMRVVPGSGA